MKYCAAMVFWQTIVAAVAGGVLVASSNVVIAFLSRKSARLSDERKYASDLQVAALKAKHDESIIQNREGRESATAFITAHNLLQIAVVAKTRETEDLFIDTHSCYAAVQLSCSRAVAEQAQDTQWAASQLLNMVQYKGAYDSPTLKRLQESLRAFANLVRTDVGKEPVDSLATRNRRGGQPDPEIVEAED